MGTFQYTAEDNHGRRHRGVITAETGRQARDELRLRGLRVQEVNERSNIGSHQWNLGSRRPRYRGKLTVAVRELSTLLQSGVPLLAALDSILEESRGGFRTCLLSLRDRVAGGSGLAEAMAKEPAVFDAMTIGMIRVGEHAGNLDEVCQQVAEFRERSGELADRVLSAILYPAIVLVVSVVVSIFLMTAVVPMLLTNLTELDRQLPWPTRVLKTVSDALLDYGIVFCVGGSVLCLGLFGWLRSERGKQRSATIVFRMPVLGTLVQRQALSRMALIVSSLLRSGIELVEALKIAEQSTTSVLLKAALGDLRVDLEAGRGISESMRSHPFFSHSLRQVFHLGQQSGKLEEMLQRIGVDYDKQAATLATRLAAVLEPILILNLAIMVGFILFATVLPILEAGNVLAE